MLSVMEKKEKKESYQQGKTDQNSEKIQFLSKETTHLKVRAKEKMLKGSNAMCNPDLQISFPDLRPTLAFIWPFCHLPAPKTPLWYGFTNLIL